MNRLQQYLSYPIMFLLLANLPLELSAQQEPASSQQQKAYPKVIAEYIKALADHSNLKFDTLFIGKHEEFPKISLPALIQGKHIVVLDSQKPSTGVEKRESFVLVNIIEEKLTKEEVNFMLITFFKGYRPQHNMYIHLTLNPVSNEYELSGDPKLENAY